MSTRTPYWELTEQQREAIHTWLGRHGIHHEDVGTDVDIWHHPDGNWRIPMFMRSSEGHLYLDPTGEVATIVITVEADEEDPLPWPRCPCGTDPCEEVAAAFATADTTEETR